MILIHKHLSWCSKKTLKKYSRGRPSCFDGKTVDDLWMPPGKWSWIVYRDFYFIQNLYICIHICVCVYKDIYIIYIYTHVYILKRTF